jgi:hypothetical protein
MSAAKRPQFWADLGPDGRVALALVLDGEELTVIYLQPAVAAALGNRLLDLAEAARW